MRWGAHEPSDCTLESPTDSRLWFSRRALTMASSLHVGGGAGAGGEEKVYVVVGWWRWGRGGGCKALRENHLYPPPPLIHPYTHHLSPTTTTPPLHTPSPHHQHQHYRPLHVGCSLETGSTLPGWPPAPPSHCSSGIVTANGRRHPPVTAH